MNEKILRDPVHDVVAFRFPSRTPGSPASGCRDDGGGDLLLWQLLQAPEFQRLRRVRQLGLASLAYPGADHTRFSHSVGVMEMCRKILDQLSRSVRIDACDRLAAVTAALLHDLGHGPFSHVFERVSGVHHEKVTRRVIAEEDSAVHRLLAAYDPALPARVAGLLEGPLVGASSDAGVGRVLHDCISSQLDADRLDYLLRDDLMTGSRYGQYDLHWLVRSLTVDEKTMRLAVSYKGVSAVEAYLQARHHMYRNVYFHKVVRSGEGMLRLALQRARRLAVQDRLPGGDVALGKSLLGQKLTMPEMIGLDDVSVLHCFKLWTTSDDAVLAGLCHGLLFRKLYKTIELPVEAPPEEVAHMLKRVAEAITAAGGDIGYDFFYDEPSHTPYEAVSPDDPSGAGEILVLDAAGALRPFTAMSSFADSLKHFAFRRIHIREDFKPLALRAIGKR
jgi:HD superfamily phosphohydrolase